MPRWECCANGRRKTTMERSIGPPFFPKVTSATAALKNSRAWGPTHRRSKPERIERNLNDEPEAAETPCWLHECSREPGVGRAGLHCDGSAQTPSFDGARLGFALNPQ